MMHTITAQNVNDALLKGMTLLYSAGQGTLRETRNGPAYVMPEPVTTHYRYPTQRVLFSPERDANPFFHLLEALWMLGGQRDVQRMAWLVPRMAEYSDDGKIFHAAYGYRWRHWRADIDTREDEYEEYDQIIGVITELQTNPRSRRAIIQMWDPVQDMGKPPIGAKDLPCNTTIKFSRRIAYENSTGSVEALDMVVFNRSNDIIMGCYGANAVHLSVLQEYVAAMLGVRVGWYEQVSCDWHAYKEEFDGLWQKLSNVERWHDPYTAFMGDTIMVKSLVDDTATFDTELKAFLECWERNNEPMIQDPPGSPTRLATWKDWQNKFLPEVAWPMLIAYRHYRNRDDPRQAYHWLDECIENGGRIDWLVAGRDWMRRRVIARARRDPRSADLIKEAMDGLYNEETGR